jgi:hypothetical protein
MSRVSTPETVRLYHFTPSNNLCAIIAYGLQTQFAQGRRKGIWLCAWSTRTWAKLHVAEWHGVGVDSLAELHVSVSSDLLMRVREGVYVVMSDIPADQIRVKN